MELTFIGYAQIVLGLFVVIAGNMRHALLLLMLSALFNGSAAILLPSLGDSSIPPIQFALAFVLLRILMPGSAAIGDIPEAIKANRWFALFSLYGIATAFILPRVFARSASVYPMRFDFPGNQFASVPLEPTSQNFTAAFYLLGAFLSAIAVWIACRRRDTAALVVTTFVVMAWIHAILGVAGVAVRGTSAETVFQLFRNSAYAQFDNEVGGFVRIRGLFPEASAYAAFGFILFVTNAEMWYRSIRKKATGLATVVMGVVLFFSTSSTAYFGLVIYGLFFALRIIALPVGTSLAKAKIAVASIGLLIFLAAFAFLISPELVESVVDVVKRMTVEKSSSESSLQRLYWTRQGWELFLFSYGLGVGPGSFRSSSIFFAILGSMGVVGIVSFLIYVITAFQPWRRSSWSQTTIPSDNLGGALGSAALLSLIPAVVNSATAVPGASFAILAGASLALRPFDRARQTDPHTRPDFPVTASTITG